MNMKRCSWVPKDNLLYQSYHDKEWGRPLHDDQSLFEALSLESYQSGLSFLTVLKKREAFRQAFYDYDMKQVADMTIAEVDQLMANPAIIRHRKKLEATVKNAQVILELIDSQGSFYQYLKQFSKDYHGNDDLWAKNLSKDLKKRGMSFVGPTTCLSFLQATGFINAHEETCYINQS